MKPHICLMCVCVCVCVRACARVCAQASASCVWASCCGLLNEVMGAGAVRGQQPGFGGTGPFRFTPSAGYSTHTNPHTHTYTHTNPHTHTLSCLACRESFSIFRRRYLCSECGRSFCSQCSVLQEDLRTCGTCDLLKGTAFQRPSLMKLHVKDLRRYLTLRNINTDTCREKEDLVNLVLFHRRVESEDESDTPTVPRRPLYTPPTTDSAPLLSSAQEEPISRENGSGSTSEPLVESSLLDASLFTLESTGPTPEVERRAGRASLSDLSCVEEVEQLSVRQLKEILTRNFVNFSGCCEKWELMERVSRLYTEKQHLENVSCESRVVAFRPDAVGDSGHTRLTADENVCRICMDAVIDCVLLECGHMVTCTKCGKRMSECPICRQYVIRAVHVFRS